MVWCAGNECSFVVWLYETARYTPSNINAFPCLAACYIVHDELSHAQADIQSVFTIKCEFQTVCAQCFRIDCCIHVFFCQVNDAKASGLARNGPYFFKQKPAYEMEL